MKTTVNLAVLCLGTGLGLATAAQAQQTQQFDGQQMMRQQPFGQQQQFNGQMGQQPFGQQQFGQQQGLTEQRIRNFFKQTENVLQQTARTQDPGQLQQYLNQYLAPNAVITSVSELYLGDRLVATTIAHADDETVTDALGHAATALQGRKLVSDYNIDISVRDIQMLPGENAARVTTLIREEGVLGGPVARRVAERVGQARERVGQLRQQWDQGQGQWSQTPEAQTGQLGQRLQQGWGQAQDGQFQQGQPGMGTGMAAGPGRGGAPEEGIRFQTRANCTHEVLLQQGQIRIGNTFCRGMMRLG